MSKPKTAITPTRAENFPEWYQEVIKSADLANHAVVRGCMVMKPHGFAMWEEIQRVLDAMIKATGHQNVYFPLLIPLSFLAKEADHVEGFAKECAVVTHYRLETNDEGELVPSPDAKLQEPLVIRPTSETIIGHEIANWISSYKDLPVKINQWCNIMRWEMRTRLFLRTSEFLWQEGHTAHATQDEAMAETLQMLDVYETLVQDYMAIPVIKGEKTPAERFPGAVNTFTIEAMMQDGKALQVGTSHFLGQNFSKAYEIQFNDRDQQLQFVWTTSWGVSTRLIGALLMTHSDDDGLVLPPKIAPQQIAIIPFVMKEPDEQTIFDYCDALAKELNQIQYHGKALQVTIDKSDDRAGEKFWRAVKKGYPIRLEIGMREINEDQLSLTRRDKAAKDKTLLKRTELLSQIVATLDDIQQQLFDRALAFQQARTHLVNSAEELAQQFKEDDTLSNGFAVGYFDPALETDEKVASFLKDLKVTTRCIPLDQDGHPGRCIFSQKEVTQKVIFARAY